MTLCAKRGWFFFSTVIPLTLRMVSSILFYKRLRANSRSNAASVIIQNPLALTEGYCIALDGRSLLLLL